MSIKAYKLYDRAAVMQPAPMERDGDAAPGATSADRAMHAASGTGWVLLCPHAFEVTWNGGPNPEDITIRLDAAEDDAPAFVQSNLGNGLLTFYSGYQLQTTRANSLWVRGLINQPKDGLYALVQVVVGDAGLEGLGRGGEATGDGHAQPGQVADHLAQRGILAADAGQVGQSELVQPQDVLVQVRCSVEPSPKRARAAVPSNVEPL